MIKIHPPHQLIAPNAPELADVYRECEARGVPVMFHTGTSVFPRARNVFADPMPIDDVAVDFPNLKIILAHAGRPLYGETAFFLARRHPNLHLDISGIPPKSLPRYVPRVAALYAAVFLFNGIALPFFPVWLGAKGLDPALMGLTLAIPMFARVLSVPLAAREADRRDAVRAWIVLAAWGNVAGNVLVGLSSGGVVIMASYALASFIYTPLLPLTDAYTLKGLAERGRAFGPVRLWGSAAFVAGNFLGGFFADAIPAVDLIWPIVGSVVLIAIAASMLLPTGFGALFS